MNKVDKRLRIDIRNILYSGFEDKNPRPKYSDGVPAHTLSVNQVVREYDLSNGEFPITTLRPIAWKSGVKEILWIFSKQSNSLDVLENEFGVKYWKDWESKDEPNTIGQRYGATIHNYDQINKLLNGLIDDPFGRRHIIDMYQFADFEKTDGLIPCAFCSIWNIRKQNGELHLDMSLIQRSGDMLTASGAGGINEVQYAVLQYLVAHHCGYKVGKFLHFVANEQIYDRHIDNAIIMCNRKSVECNPKLILNPDKKNFFDFTIDDIILEDYPVDKIKEQNPQLKFDLGI